MGLRVWSGGEIFGKKIKTLLGAHKAPPSKLRLKYFTVKFVDEVLFLVLSRTKIFKSPNGFL